MEQVTVALLVYRSPEWLDFVLDGLRRARNRTTFRTLVVGNDAEPDVVKTGRLDIDFRNENPEEHYIRRVYRAWNLAVQSAETETVVLINSDMYVSDFWLDELVLLKLRDPRSLPCSLLVESGRIPSGMPEHVKNFGLTPQTFDKVAWNQHAQSVRRAGQSEPGRLFMPVLLNRREFLCAGGYPIGNIGGCSGDLILFSKLAGLGRNHETALGSVVYHVQEGEMRDKVGAS